MIFRAHHLREECLFECYLAEKDGQPMEPPAAEHLADCASCNARYADLRSFMEGLHSEADRELDEVFPADRLRAQQLQIARRIEHVGHPARIISFPGHAPSHTAVPHQRVAPRWLVAAAAAGLAIGVSVGSFLYQGNGAATEPSAPVLSNTAAAAPAEVVLSRPSEPANEEFLSELEFALERPYTPELVALDELTPHVREVRISRVSR